MPVAPKLSRHVSNISDVVEGAGFIVLTNGQKGHHTVCDVSVGGPGGKTGVPVGRAPTTGSRPTRLTITSQRTNYHLRRTWFLGGPRPFLNSGSVTKRKAKACAGAPGARRQSQARSQAPKPKRASVLYSCLMPIITRYMHTNSTLGVSAGSPHTSVSRMTVLRFSGLVLDTGN